MVTMRKQLILSLLFGVCLLVVSCQKDDSVTEPEKIDNNFLLSNEAITMDLISIVNESHSLSSLTTELRNNDPIRLDQVKVLNNNSSASMSKMLNKINDKQLLAEKEGVIQIPELSFLEGSDADKKSKVLYAFPPKGNENEWKYIKAFDSDGNVYNLDVHQKPDYSVIIVDVNGKHAFKEVVNRMNKELTSLGIQVERGAVSKADGLETTVLESISLKNDSEPWIKGAAEIYAISSGIIERDGEVKPQVRIIEMPYLDYQGTTYYPNQVMLFWKDYDYQAANIQFFEHDSNYNYKELCKILFDGLFKIISAATGEPIVAMVGEMGSAVIEIIPDAVFTDDDDYVDSYYTIMKNQTYQDRVGANNNATATFKPLFIPNN